MAEKKTYARPYAKAVFELATKAKNYDHWLNMLSALNLMVQDKRVQALLRNPSVSPTTVSDFFISILGTHLDNQGKNLLHILATSKRLMLIPEIKSLFEHFYDRAKNILQVECKTAIPLTEEKQQQFVEMLNKKFERTIHLRCEVEPNLLGGFWLKAGDTIMDGSVRGQLMKLKDMMGG